MGISRAFVLGSTARYDDSGGNGVFSMIGLAIIPMSP